MVQRWSTFAPPSVFFRISVIIVRELVDYGVFVEMVYLREVFKNLKVSAFWGAISPQPPRGSHLEVVRKSSEATGIIANYFTKVVRK